MAEARREFHPASIDEEGREALVGCILDASDSLAMCGAFRRLAAASSVANSLEGLKVAVAASVLADLCEQGWDVGVEGRRIFTCAPSVHLGASDTLHAAKARVREGLMRASNRQIATESVQSFIRTMEKDRVFKNKIVSIGTLVDDGGDLAAKLAKIAPSHFTERTAQLRKLVRPVIQICDPESSCDFTGLKLQDVWRYFRHSWSLEYNPSPGRTLRVLIRNKARPNWPVMGIAMLASPAANLYSRDEWIGWRLENVTEGIADGSLDAAKVATALVAVLKSAISEIRTDDLIARSLINRPTAAAYFMLGQIAATAGSARQKDLSRHALGTGERDLIDIRSLGKGAITQRQWKELSGTALYRRKRAEQLIPLLKTLSFLRRHDFERSPAAAICEALVTKNGREAISFALNEIRKRKLASEIVDVSVCGAIAPYNELIGGKLVALAMASQEMRDAYFERYANQTSEIASQLAGRRIVRSSELKVLTTTSLYGVGSSQYNRLKLRAQKELRSSRDISWEELRPSEGFSVTHLSKLTVGYMRRLGVTVYGAQRINSVFGEGSSPRTRQVREGLNLIGINNDGVLKHSIGRKVYACELYPGARKALCGFEEPKKKAASAAPLDVISQGWLERWVAERIRKPEVLARITKSGPHTVSAGFRLRQAQGLEDIDEEISKEQPNLFSHG